MNIRFITGLLLAGIALSGHADESTQLKPSAAIHNYGVAEPVRADLNTQDTLRFHFGTQMTSAVITDISARIEDDLEAQMTRELDTQKARVKPQTEPLLVSNN